MGENFRFVRYCNDNDAWWRTLLLLVISSSLVRSLPSSSLIPPSTVGGSHHQSLCALKESIPTDHDHLVFLLASLCVSHCPVPIRPLSLLERISIVCSSTSSCFSSLGWLNGRGGLLACLLSPRRLSFFFHQINFQKNTSASKMVFSYG